MKNNLETFPKCCLDEKHYCERDVWKQDFEKEFREDLPWVCEDCYVEGKRCSPTFLCGAMNYLKKEILGKKSFIKTLP